MAPKSRDFGQEISWERVRAIFGDAEPPAQIWERQFDYFDSDLKRKAATPYREIDRDDLWYYFHDLAYVELQPELFAYLFPVCLMEWHDTLLRNESCSHGDAEFHYGMRQGKIFDKMLSPQQQDDVAEFFRDSFVQRLDAEPVSVQPTKTTHPFGWICRFNSLGMVLRRIDPVWESWWNVETRGRAIAVLKYCSGLVYFEGENRLFGFPSCHIDGRWGPSLWEHDSFIHRQGWFESNLNFLRRTLTFDYVVRKLDEAAARLEDGERELARTELADATRNHEIVESRIAELPLLLGDEGTTKLDGWSI